MTIGDLKNEALNALKADVLSADRDGDIDMLTGTSLDPEWKPPAVESKDDFELCRAIRERGRPTGQYETLSTKDVVKQTLVNWESVFIQFRDEDGECRAFTSAVEIRLYHVVAYFVYHDTYDEWCRYDEFSVARHLTHTRNRQALAGQGIFASSSRRRRRRARILGSTKGKTQGSSHRRI